MNSRAMSEPRFSPAPAQAATPVAPSMVPPRGIDLALSSALRGSDPSNTIFIVLDGIHPPEGQRGPLMPRFDGAFTDGQLAALLGCLRAHYSQQAAWDNLETYSRYPAQQGAVMITITVNGQLHQLDVDPATPLLYVPGQRPQAQRREIRLRPRAMHGPCTVIVDGEAVFSCLTPVVALQGRTIDTVEGLGSEQNSSPLQRAFVDEQAAQCGYCSHSMQDSGTAIMNAAAQVRQILIAVAGLQLPPERLMAGEGAVIIDDGRRLGYGELVSGQILHLRAEPRSDLLDPDHYRLVGKPVPRVDIPSKVTGGAAYVQDLRLPDMAHGRVVWPPSYGSKPIRRRSRSCLVP